MKKDTNTISNNKKAYHDFTILDKYISGIILTGTEIKSIRAGKVNLKDSYASIDDGEIWLHKMHISPYEQGNQFNHDPMRKRKLLLNKKEIDKLIGITKESGITLIPLKLFIKNGWAKIELGTAKAKKLHDKRESLKKKTTDREIQKAMKHRY